MTHQFQCIRLDHTDGVATVTLNRPDRLNSFTKQMHADLRAALHIIREDEAIRVMVLTGSGRGFCAGQDLSERKATCGDAKPDLGESLEKTTTH